MPKLRLFYRYETSDLLTRREQGNEEGYSIEGMNTELMEKLTG